MNKKGLFITFEGPDGSGKSTVLAAVYDMLKKNKHAFNVAITREPGGKNNVIAEEIRNILLNRIEYQISPRAEALLFAASRAQHVKDFILPNIEAGNLVLCDRYIHSSLVYQGYARKLGIDQIWSINAFGINHVLPDLTIVFMINPEQGLARIRHNQLREFNRLDQEALSLHQLVYEGYRKIIAENHNHTIIEVNAALPLVEVTTNVFNIILEKIKVHYGE